MPQKSFNLIGLGQVTVVKRRGSRNIRLSVNSKSVIRVSQPPYIPYSMGVAFALERSDWIMKHLKNRPVISIKDGMKIGKSYQLKITRSYRFKRPFKKLTSNEIHLYIPEDCDDKQFSQYSVAAIELALKNDSLKLLPSRLDNLAEDYDYKYSELKIKKLTSRWGSCNNSKLISISYFLIQLPWELIDYVLIHELVHTKHMHHKADFWNEMKLHIPNLKERRSQMRKYNPGILNL